MRVSTAAILLSTLVLAESGCAQKPAEVGQPTPPPQATVAIATACKPGGIPRPKTVVTVYVDYEAGKATTANKTIYVCEQDDVEWVSCDGELQFPKFEAGHPFVDEDKAFNRNKKSLKSGKGLKRGSAKHGFDYTIMLKVGNTILSVDPRIEVME